MYFLRVLLILFFSISLSGCFGGGDSSGNSKFPPVNNSAPIANAGEDVSVEVGEQLRLDGSSSSDPNGDNISYLWAIISPEGLQTDEFIVGQGSNPTFLTDVAGEYVIQLTVTDDEGLSDTDSVRVVVSEVVQPDPEPRVWGDSDIPIRFDNPGFTQVVPSEDSRTIYVSNSVGADFNDGLSHLTPVKTITHAKTLLRDGFPDWLVLKAGDVWYESLGGWSLSGRSPEEPMVISHYGSGTSRPVLKVGSGRALSAQGQANVVSNLVISGIEFYAHTRHPESPEFIAVDGSAGISMLSNVYNLLIEDNKFRSFEEGVVLQEFNTTMENITLRRNVIVDSYDISPDHSQGAYFQGIDGLLLEENILDMNGWHPVIPGGEQTKFNHGFYIQNNTINVQTLGNIIMRSSSHGIQQRDGGIVNDNLFVQNAISVLHGLEDDLENSVQEIISGNVILNGTSINGEIRGWGIEVKSPNGTTVENNIMAHNWSIGGTTFDISDSAGGDAVIGNNISYKWLDYRESNVYGYLDPERGIESYDTLLGGDGTFDNFAESLRAQSLRTWNDDLSVQNINEYIREGFTVN